MGVVVGVDGAGRTFRLRRHAGSSPVWWASGDLAAGLAWARDEELVELLLADRVVLMVVALRAAYR